MANNSFLTFKPTNNLGNEIYVGLGAQGYDSMTEGYPVGWTTRSENKGRLYRKSIFTFEGTNSTTTINKDATIKLKGLPIFILNSSSSISKKGIRPTPINWSNATNLTLVISLNSNITLNDNYELNFTGNTNALWLEVEVYYDLEDSYTDNANSKTYHQATLGDPNDDWNDGGNRAAFLNRVRESLYYTFSLNGGNKIGGYQEEDTPTSQVFRMYYKLSQNTAPAPNFADFMGIGTVLDFLDYKDIEVAHSASGIDNNSTYQLITLEVLANPNLTTVGANSSGTRYQEYYMRTITTGETNTFASSLCFNTNPTYTVLDEEIHYFESFSNSTDDDYYLDDDAFIFHVRINPRGYARKWTSSETNYDYYYQWRYTPYDIKVVIIVDEPTPYLYFNNTQTEDDDNLLLTSDANNSENLPVNSNLSWVIQNLTSTENYNVELNEISVSDPLYTENNNNQ